MKVIKKEINEKTILLEDITEMHLIVAIINDSPYILRKPWKEKDDAYEWVPFDDSFTRGNAFSNSTIRDNVEEIMDTEGNKIEVFEEEDWAKALKWLIDNAK
jgi:hypothetical protein